MACNGQRRAGNAERGAPSGQTRPHAAPNNTERTNSACNGLKRPQAAPDDASPGRSASFGEERGSPPQAASGAGRHQTASPTL